MQASQVWPGLQCLGRWRIIWSDAPETTTLTAIPATSHLTSVNTAPTVVTKLQNGKVVYDFLAPPVLSVVTDTSERITLYQQGCMKRYEQYIDDER